ncbi:MAG TPA: hypothetical protein VK181_07130 [Rhizobium sp.]|nr:hypothetical protein [Rhizobium sp.]
MSAKAERWRKYAYLGRIKQARNMLLSLYKEQFMTEGLRNEVDNLERTLERLQRKVDFAIREHKK